MSRIKRIESTNNPLLKKVSKIAKTGSSELWLIEGKRLVLDALQSGIKFEELLITPERLSSNHEMKEILQIVGDRYTQISDGVMKRISSLETPPGILAVAKRAPAAPNISIKKFAAFLFGIRDPGNLGTILRSAEASGCEFVACSSDCAEPYSPKVVRGSMGSIFRIPVFKVPNELDFFEQIKQTKVRVYALETKDGVNLFSLKRALPALILIGSESAGIPETIPFDETVSIPMQGKVESLNVSMATAICFYYFSEFQSRVHENRNDSR